MLVNVQDFNTEHCYDVMSFVCSEHLTNCCRPGVCFCDSGVAQFLHNVALITSTEEVMFSYPCLLVLVVLSAG